MGHVSGRAVAGRKDYESITNEEKHPWWRVDLEREETVVKVSISSGKNFKRLKNLKIFVGNFLGLFGKNKE